jgi:hypothetical protein
VKVQLVGSESVGFMALAHFFQEKGYDVLHTDASTLDADLYVFCTGHETLRTLAQGLVILDLRDDTNLEAAEWAAYADFCLVSDAAAQTTLIETYGCEPTRIFLLPDNDLLIDLVHQGLRNTLLPAVVENRGETMIDQKRISDSTFTSPLQQTATLVARLEAIERQTDVMLRNYQIRSYVPFIGPLITWVRRNLTSHLREPYLDPMLERQVTFNRNLVVVLREILQLQTDLEARLAQLENENSHDRCNEAHHRNS